MVIGEFALYHYLRHRKLKKIKKELHLKLNEALTLADEDIKENRKMYQKTFLEGE